MLKTIEDHLGRIVEYHYPPRRIISLCPGITETLYFLQLDEKIVGRTQFCIYPTEKVRNATIVGGTKRIKLDVIQQLKPDLIIAEKEENTKEIVETLEKDFPVYVAEVQSIQDAYQMIHELGEVTGRQGIAEGLIKTISSEFQTLPHVQGKRMAYVIWKKPYMVVGKDTYINAVLEKMGFINPFTAFEGRYPSVSHEDFQKAGLDYVFLASEPFPFKDKHKMEFTEIMPDVAPIIVDGEMFWYGPRMIKAASYLRNVVGGMQK